MKPQDLQGKARQRYDTWRAMGMSESAAMAQVREDGLYGTEESANAAIARAFGRQPDGAAAGGMSLDEAYGVLNARVFDRSTAGGRPVTSALVAEAQAVVDAASRPATAESSALTESAVQAIRDRADILEREHRTWGKARCLDEAWRRVDGRLSSVEQRQQLRASMRETYPKLPGAAWVLNPSPATAVRRSPVVEGPGRRGRIEIREVSRGPGAIRVVEGGAK
jgi:hypothetical protein